MPPQPGSPTWQSRRPCTLVTSADVPSVAGCRCFLALRSPPRTVLLVLRLGTQTPTGSDGDSVGWTVRQTGLSPKLPARDVRRSGYPVPSLAVQRRLTLPRENLLRCPSHLRLRRVAPFPRRRLVPRSPGSGIGLLSLREDRLVLLLLHLAARLRAPPSPASRPPATVTSIANRRRLRTPQCLRRIAPFPRR